VQSIPSWLPQFVEKQMESQGGRGVLSGAVDGMLLYGTIGHAAYLRPDGSVWYQVTAEASEATTDEWQVASYIERIDALVIATKRYPELLELLPLRPSDVPNCGMCKGSGRVVAEMNCTTCGGLGWVPDEAA